MKLTVMSLVFLSVPGLCQTLSRETISATGAANSTSGVTIQQTIGQPYQTQTFRSDGISFRPGFQQPVFNTELISTTIEVLISPNPALLSFFIETSDTLYNAELVVYDERGRLIIKESMLVFKKHEVLCSTWANGVYYVTVSDQKKNLISTKLVKHQ